MFICIAYRKNAELTKILKHFGLHQSYNSRPYNNFNNSDYYNYRPAYITLQS